MPTTEPQINQAIVNAIVLKLGALRKIPCPGTTWKSVLILTHVGEYCQCHGIGFITDPSYQAALELLIDPASPTTPQHCWWVVGWPGCAVVGLLEGVVRKVHSPKLYAFLINWKHDPNYGSVAMLSDLYMRGVTPFRWPDPDDAPGLGKALLEALS